MGAKEDAESKFGELRAAAYRIAEEAVRENVDDGIRLTSITERALEQASTWPRMRHSSSKREAAYWNWSTEVARFRRRARRVELAIWHEEDLLCGLSLGRTSNHRVTATIHLLEANPNQTRLSGQIAAIAIRYLETYARILGSRKIVIDHPFEALVPFYERLGFTQRVTRGTKVVRLLQDLTYS